MTIKQTITMTQAIFKILPWASSVILAGLLSWTRLWGDDHFATINDAKYVKIAVYASDRTNDATVQGLRDKQAAQDRADIRAEIKEVHDDVKVLLLRSAKP